MFDTYKCKKCGDEWRFCPEDYEGREEFYPQTCPYCNMPFWEMVKNVYSDEGIKAVIKRIKLC